MAMAARSGLPLSRCPAGAWPHETPFVGPLIACRLTEGKPSPLMGDKADDRDPLDEACREWGVEWIAPPRNNRTQRRTPDGRT